MRDIVEWDRSDLEALCESEAQEGLKLDFKSVRGLQGGNLGRDLSKDVAAFANADGGLIVFGVIERDRVAIGIEDGVAADVMTAERLEDIILGNTDPRVVGVRTHAIPVGNGRYAFVVQVPAATTRAPHQAADNRYYRRYESKNLPMADHEVRDLLRRGTTPAPRVNLTLVDGEIRNGEWTGRIVASATNEAAEPILYAVVSLYVETDLVIDNPIGWESHEVSGEADGRPVQFRNWSTNWAVPGRMPLFKGSLYGLLDHRITTRVDGRMVIGWRVVCPGAEAQAFETWITRGTGFEKLG